MKKQIKTNWINIRVTDEERKAVKQAADRLGFKSISAFIRNLCSEYVRQSA